MSGSDYQNPRRHPRYSLRTRCWCESDAVTLYAAWGNLSLSGGFVRTSAPLSEGAPVRLRWIMPGSTREIVVSARVVWSRPQKPESGDPPGMGLEFTQCGEDFVAALQEYVRDQQMYEAEDQGERRPPKG